MFPVAIVGKTNYHPYMTFAIIVVNVLVFLMQAIVHTQGEAAITHFYTNYALSMCHVGVEPITMTLRNGLFSLFLHSGIMHIFFNMTMFWIFAPRVEAYLGHRRFLILYLILGYAAHVGQTLLGMPVCNPAIPGGGGIIIGASGAIAGIMGAFLFLHPGAKVRTAIIFFRIPFGVVNASAWFYLSYWFIMDFIQGIGILPSDGVGHWAHLGGFVTGFVILFIAGMFKPAPSTSEFEYLDD